MIKVFIDNKYLLNTLVKKDIEQRYKGSVLGILWAVLVPLLMLAIYTFVFSEIFQAKWNVSGGDKYEFAMVLFCGLSAFNMVSEVMSRSTNLIASNTNYVKKVIFPLELLPAVATFSALFNCIISYLILILAKLILYKTISITLYQIIMAFLPLCIFCMGISLIISALSVYLKDIGNVISIVVMILMYMSPVFFSLSAVPGKFRIICEINPMTYIIENFRNVVLYGSNIDWKFYILSLLASIALLVIGKIIFERTKVGFADVL
ncbi:MAG: ABC transporter permease [Enterocloster bolteae]